MLLQRPVRLAELIGPQQNQLSARARQPLMRRLNICWYSYSTWIGPSRSLSLRFNLEKIKRNLLVAPSSMPFGNQGVDEALFYVYRVLSSNTTSFDRGLKIGLNGPETGDI